MNTWMTGENWIKHHYKKRNIFCNHLDVDDITDADYSHAKRVCKDFKITNLSEYHDLHI